MFKLAVSNIAWNPAWTELAYRILRDYQISHLEIAPTAINPLILNWSKKQCERKKDEIADMGFTIVSAQSLVFGRPEFNIFSDTSNAMAEYLKLVIEKCSWLGCQKLIFGSPKNRIKGNLALPEALPIAANFFQTLAATCETNKVELVIEANAKNYGCDFLNRYDEVNQLIDHMGSPVVQLHLDTGNIVMEESDPGAVFSRYLPRASHMQISAPGLAPLNELSLFEFKRSAVHELYKGPFVSLEVLCNKTDIAVFETEFRQSLDVFTTFLKVSTHG